MDGLGLIRRLHEHRRWSNAKLREAAASLGESQLHRHFPFGQGSLWATLAHMHAAERVWLEVLQGRADAPLDDGTEFASLAELNDAWAELERRWEAYLDTLNDGALEKPIPRINSRGRQNTTPAYDALVHVCTHAHYTGGQATSMMRALGVTGEVLPDLQLITLSREQESR